MLKPCRNGHPRENVGPCKQCKAARQRRYRSKTAYKAEHSYYLKNRQRILARAKSYQQKHRKRYSAYVKAYDAAHPEKLIARTRRTYAKRRAKLILKAKIYRENNPEKFKACKQRSFAKHIKSMSDWYIKRQLQKQMNTAIPLTSIPQELIEAKRAHLAIQRLIKEKTK